MREEVPSILWIVEFIVPNGAFFHAQAHVLFHIIIEEFSPNVRMIHGIPKFTLY
jgi:hypothetical protein